MTATLTEALAENAAMLKAVAPATIETIVKPLPATKKAVIKTPPPTPEQVTGTNGDDTITAGKALQTLDGGAGIDKLVFEEGTRGIDVNLARGTMIDSFGQKEKLTGFEIIVGTSMNDRIIGSNDTDYLVGGAGDDKLYGGKGNDELYGGEGNDLLDGGNGSDYMVGGQGNDTFKGGSGFDTVDYADDGGLTGISIDLLAGKGTDGFGDTDTFSGIDRVRASYFDDKLLGSNGANMLDGYGGNDYIDGRNGNDTLLGQFGDDTILGGNGNDILVGGHGNDLLDGGAGSKDVVDYAQDGGWRGVSVHLGTGFAEDSWGSLDTLVNIERVVGTGLNDWIMGNSRANVLTGGAGDDWLAGGGGNDTFVFAFGHGHDLIQDFNRGDKLDVSGLGFRSLDDVRAAAVGHDRGLQLNTGEGSSIVLVDVNISTVSDLSYIFMV